MSWQLLYHEYLPAFAQGFVELFFSSLLAVDYVQYSRCRKQIKNKKGIGMLSWELLCYICWALLSTQDLKISATF